MKYSSMMTSKGQVTIPIDIRRKLGLKPGQAVSFDVSGDVVRVEAPSWRKELAVLHERVREHLERKGLKPLSDEELRGARLRAHEEMAAYRVERMRDSQ